MGQRAWLTQLREAQRFKCLDWCPVVSPGLRWSLPEALGAPQSLLGCLTLAQKQEVIRFSPELRSLGLWLSLA